MVALFRRFHPSHEPPPATDEPDAVLVARARADREAFAPLYLRYVEEIGRFCYIRLREAEAARDATQQVFAQALAALPRYRESGQFRAWLYTDRAQRAGERSPRPATPPSRSRRRSRRPTRARHRRRRQPPRSTATP